MSSRLAISLLTTSLYLLPSCALDEGKGAEEGTLGEYESKTDSFRNPTEHGELVFGVPQTATLKKGEEFHAWDFELSDDAEVRLSTILVTVNLDTVMYLYKFDESAQKFGRYKFKNDDASSDTVASELSKSLDAGRYRVVVKGFKSALRGEFKLAADCEGSGCAASSCDIANFIGLPSTTSDSCGELFSAALNTSTSTSNSAIVTLDERCSLPTSVAAAIEQYVDYFGGLDEFNSSFDFGSTGDPIKIDVRWDTHTNGTMYVQLDAGGDEAAMDYLIAGNGQVIAHYQHNQSADQTLYCDGFMDYVQDETCFFEYTKNFPHAAADERQLSETVTPATAATQLEAAAAIAVSAYATELGLSANTSIEVEARLWDLDGSGVAGRVVLKSAGQEPFVYELQTLANTQFQFTVKRGSAKIEYDCQEL